MQEPASGNTGVMFPPPPHPPEPVDKVIHHRAQLGVSSSSAHLTSSLAQGVEGTCQRLTQAEAAVQERYRQGGWSGVQTGMLHTSTAKHGMQQPLELSYRPACQARHGQSSC